MLVGYLLVMGCLALGLRTLRRHPAGTEETPRRPGGRRAHRLAPGAMTRGWPALIRQVADTAVGGYVLLMAVLVGYYHGVAGLGGGFLASAFTGAATLVGITLPVFLAMSWLVERRRRRRTNRGSGSREGSE
jgi:hypothetical protein